MRPDLDPPASAEVDIDDEPTKPSMRVHELEEPLSRARASLISIVPPDPLPVVAPRTVGLWLLFRGWLSFKLHALANKVSPRIG